MKLELTRAELMALGVSEALAQYLDIAIKAIDDSCEPLEFWTELTRVVLTPQIPFPVHQFLYERVSDHWHKTEAGAMPAWRPSLARQQASNLARLSEHRGITNFEALYQWSVTHPNLFWAEMIKRLGIVFDEPYTTLCDASQGVHAPTWLPGARLNIAESCFNAGQEAVAVVYRRHKDARMEKVSYGKLEQEVNRAANGLLALGLRTGDAIAIDMNMTLESVIVYLAIVKAGCIVISIADSFSAPEIETRLRIGQARAIFTMDYLTRSGKKLPLYEKVLQAKAPQAIVIPNGESIALSLRAGDLAWTDFLSENTNFKARPREPHDTINILFSSGTTGDPKAIPWNHTTPIKAGSDGHLHQDIQTGDVVCWPSSLGWMMGPWLLYASLLNKATIALYYDAPTGSDFCQFVEDAAVTMLGVVPSLVKAWRKSGACEGSDWSQVRAFSSTGECSSPADMLYLMSQAGYQPIIEYIGGTEIGGGYAAGTVLQPAIPATFSTATLGTKLLILNQDNQPSESGELFLEPPTMGLSVSLLNKDHYNVYFEGTPTGLGGTVLRRHGDQFARLAGGYLRALGRADDTMNLGGIKVSSAEIERTFIGVPYLDETAAIAITPADGGPDQLVVYVRLTTDLSISKLKPTLQAAIRTKLNPLFRIHEVVQITSLPRTSTGKIMRRLLRDQYYERT